MNSAAKAALFLCFFVSGACGLIYEVLWSRYFGLFIGNSVYAHAIVLSAFMAGLAIGNFYFGRIADRITNCLRAYAKIEIAIGLYAFLTPLILLLNRLVFIKLGSLVEPGSPMLMLLKVVIAFPTILLPTALMGGTLPLMARVLVTNREHVQNAVGMLYAVNSLGAVAGSILSGFVLLPVLGLNQSLFVAATLNIAAAGLAWLVRPATAPTLEDSEAKPPTVAMKIPEEVTALQIKSVLLAVSFSGAIAMIYELAWFRLFALVLGSSTYSFALMLAAFISGLTLGSMLVSTLHRWTRQSYSLLVFCHVAVAGFIAVSLLAYERIPFLFILLKNSHPLFKSSFYSFELVKYVLTFSVMLIPTAIFGMTLPLTTSMTCKQVANLGRSVGTAFANNTIGSMIGSLMAGFVLLPVLGLKLTFVVGTVANAALGGMLLIHHQGLSRMGAYRWLLASLPPLLALLIGVVSPDWSPALLSSGGYRIDFPFTKWSQFSEFKVGELGRTVLYHKDGGQVTVLVAETETRDNIFLKVNGKPDASSMGDRATQLMLAHIPALLHPHPRTVLNIGLGSGMTCGSLLRYDSIDRLDVAEISNEVREACVYFKDHNYEFYNDPRANIYIEDAKTFLQLSRSQYDIIVSEPSNPWVSGVASLFTREFFDQAKKHLAPNGIFAQWLHAYEISEDNSKLVIRTLSEVFPQVSIWSVIGNNDLVLLGTQERISADYDRIEQRMNLPEVNKDLARINVRDVPCFLLHEIVPVDSVRTIVGPGPLNTDSHPLLEYRAPKDFFLKLHSSNFYRSVNEKATNLKHGALLIQNYLKVHKLTQENYKNLYELLKITDSQLLTSVAQAWALFFPEDPQLAKSRLLLKYDVRNDLGKLKDYEESLKDGDKDPRRLVEYLTNYFRVYSATRTIFYTVPMERWVDLCELTRREHPGESSQLTEMLEFYRRIEGIR